MPVLLVLLLGLPGALASVPVAGTPAPTVAAPSGWPGPRTAAGEPAAGRFLVARRAMADPNFRRTVVYLLSHDEAGSWGLVVNRRSDLRLSDAVPEYADTEAGSFPLLLGGPVQIDTVLMLLRAEAEPEWSLHVAADVYVSADRRTLRRLVDERKPAEELRFFAGYAGWAPGQLAGEIEADGWHVTEADVDAVFGTDLDGLWMRLIDRLEPIGIQVDRGEGLPASRRLSATRQ